MIRVNSTVKMNMAEIERLTDAAVLALEETAEHLHTEIVQAQVVPRETGTLQNEGFFVDYSESADGRVALVHNTPYARRLYFHPEYNFNQEGWDEVVYGKRGKYAKNGREYKGKIIHHEGNANAKGKWFEDWVPLPDGNGKNVDAVLKAYKKYYRERIEL